MGFGKALVRGGLTESFRKLFPHVEVGEDTVREWVRDMWLVALSSRMSKGFGTTRCDTPLALSPWATSSGAEVLCVLATMHASRIASSSGRPASRRERKMDVME